MNPNSSRDHPNAQNHLSPPIVVVAAVVAMPAGDGRDLYSGYDGGGWVVAVVVAVVVVWRWW